MQQLHQQLLDAKTQRRSGSLNGPLGDDDYEDAQSIFFFLFSLIHYYNPICLPPTRRSEQIDRRLSIQVAEGRTGNCQLAGESGSFRNPSDSLQKHGGRFRKSWSRIENWTTQTATWSKSFFVSVLVSFFFSYINTSTHHNNFQPIIIHIWDECHLQ